MVRFRGFLEFVWFAGGGHRFRLRRHPALQFGVGILRFQQPSRDGPGDDDFLEDRRGGRAGFGRQN
jgi:hypothetical protein